MIELQNVTKKFETFTALDSMSLKIPKGNAYGLLGSNGAGKSTILRLCAGIYKQDSGAVLVDNEHIFDNTKIKSKIIFINDETIQWNDYTLNEMKSYFKLFYDRFSEERFENLWQHLKLPRDKKINTFSKGMKRQSIVICGIAACPDYLFLDEAFDGLDPMMRLIIKKILSEVMADIGLTTVFSSHNLKEIEEFCDRAGLLHKGKLIFDRDLESVKGNIHKIQTAFSEEIIINNKEDWNNYFPTLPCMHFDKIGSVIYVIAKGESDFIQSVVSNASPKILDIIPLSLEEIFIYEMEGKGYELDGIDTKYESSKD